MSYSVAIRTLGKSRYLESELHEIFSQTVKPQKVLIFIAEGYPRPEFQIATEEYIFVKKGMMSQRLIPYEEMNSDYLLMLDDDISLQKDSVEQLLSAMEENDAHLVGADTFQNHKLPLIVKIKAALSNFVFPHFSQKWAFKIHKNGSFSYINSPKKNFYPSQSCAGNAMLWRKDTYDKLYMQDELWLDLLPFAYGDDMLESYKVFKNGFKSGVVFDSGIIHLDQKSASAGYQANPDKIKIRTMAQFSIWWRTCYKPGNNGFFSQRLAIISFSFKIVWLFKVCLILSLVKWNSFYIKNFLNGITEGWKFVNSDKFKSIPPYVVR